MKEKTKVLMFNLDSNLKKQIEVNRKKLLLIVKTILFYVILESKTIHEDFLQFPKVVDLSGEALGKTIIQIIE